MGAVFGKIREETPSYTVIRQSDDYEIRRYDPMVLAEVRSENVDGADQMSEREFTSTAFRALARYIGVFTTPRNIKRCTESTADESPDAISMTAPVLIESGVPDAIAMTAPVLMSNEESSSRDDATSKDSTSTSKKYRMSFVLPASRFKSADEAPIPTEKMVTLRERPATVEAVRVFSWNINEEWCNEQKRELLESLQRDGVVVKEGARPEIAGYNAPWTLPWLKTNECRIEVEFDE